MTALTALLPLEGYDHAGALMEPLIGLAGFVVVIAVLIMAFLLLRRFGVLPTKWPVLLRRSAPEDSARQILAERMAKGEMSTEEFMERASVINWTPGISTPKRLPRI